jgi:hypothetical protein
LPLTNRIPPRAGGALGCEPGVVMTGVEHVTRREVCGRRAEVAQAQTGVAAATQRDRGLI